MAIDETDPVIGEEGGAPAEDLASVVLVERGEDVSAVCGRIDAAPTWAVVLHAPEGNRSLSAELGMRRLIHHAQDGGKVVAIATRSSALASRARELGVPVARKPTQIRWDAGGRRVVSMGRLSLAPPSVGRYIQVAIIAGVAFLGLAALFTVAPSARVTAYPPTETVSEVITVTASEAQTSLDLESFEVPARRVTSEQTITLALKTTGTTQVGTVPAKARVVVSNPTGASVVVAQGTVVFSGAEFTGFLFDETVTAPPNGSVEAGVTASQPGTSGNVAAGTITGWEPERLRFLTLTNPAPAAGGVSEPRPAVGPADALALAELAAGLEGSDEASRALVRARPHDAVFLSTALSEVSLGEMRPAVGTPATVVFLDVTLRLSALAVVENTLDELARAVLVSRSGEGEFIPGTVRAVETGARQLDADTATIRTELRLQGEFARGVTSSGIRSAVLGKSEDDARSTLSERYGIQDSEVRLSGWAPRLPRFGFRVDVALAVREPARGSGFPLPNATPTTATATRTPTSGP